MSDEPNIRLGEHMSSDDFEPILVGELGTKDNPYLVARENWPGLPYGAWCRCGECGNLGRSTLGFDFYAKEPGDKLQCETCMWREMRRTT
jgi:hypothetical protein